MVIQSSLCFNSMIRGGIVGPRSLSSPPCISVIKIADPNLSILKRTIFSSGRACVFLHGNLHDRHKVDDRGGRPFGQSNVKLILPTVVLGRNDTLDDLENERVPSTRPVLAVFRCLGVNQGGEQDDEKRRRREEDHGNGGESNVVELLSKIIGQIQFMRQV
jgi:hypothetical protein